MQYAEAVGYLLDHGYIEEYPDHPHGLYRITNKGLEEILSHPQTLLGETPPREQSGPRRLPEGIQRAT
jgi:hypothetical protein